MHRNLFSTLTTIVMLAGLSGCQQTTSEPAADQVFLHGGVYVADQEHHWAEAVAVTDGAIVFVGSDEDAQAYIGASTAVTDLTGKMLMPGFHDGHAHVLDGGQTLNICNLEDSNDSEKIRAILIACRDTRNYGADAWVIGSQWQLSAFGPSGPTKDILDEVFSGRPAVFVDSFHHNSWVSSKALELAGIDATTPNPEGGVIVKDPETGEPTGTLREAAMALVADIVPQPTAEQAAANLASGLAEAARFGITAYIEPGMKEASLQPYLEADKNGTLTSRVLISLSPIGLKIAAFGSEIYDLVAKRDAFKGKYLSANSVKVFMDGVIETRTSNMIEPYDDDQSNFNTFYDQETANHLYQKLDKLGLQIHTHAIGDGAIRTALNAYQFALEQNGPNDNRHQIVHLQLIDETDIPRFTELNVAANFQALWAYPDEYVYLAVPMIGQQRVDNFYRIKSVVDTGALLVGGSDWPVSSMNPLDAIEVAVRRQDPATDDGPIHAPSERVDLATILDAYTRNGAYLMHLEDKTGTVEVGKRADLIVLNNNLFEIPATKINETKVLLTLMDGKKIYQAE